MFQGSQCMHLLVSISGHSPPGCTCYDNQLVQQASRYRQLHGQSARTCGVPRRHSPRYRARRQPSPNHKLPRPWRRPHQWPPSYIPLPAGLANHTVQSPERWHPHAPLGLSGGDALNP